MHNRNIIFFSISFSIINTCQIMKLKSFNIRFINQSLKFFGGHMLKVIIFKAFNFLNPDRHILVSTNLA